MENRNNIIHIKLRNIAFITCVTKAKLIKGQLKTKYNIF